MGQSGDLEPNQFYLLWDNHIFHDIIDLNLELASLEVVHEHVVQFFILRQFTLAPAHKHARMMVPPEIPQVVEPLTLHLLVRLNFVLCKGVYGLVLLRGVGSAWVRHGSTHAHLAGEYGVHFSTLLYGHVGYIYICILLAHLT